MLARKRARSRSTDTIENIFHLTYSLLDADDDGTSDDAVADVEFDNLGDCGDRRDIFVIETVAGVHLETEGLRESCCIHDRLPLFLPFRSGQIAICAGVDFNSVSAHFARCFDLCGVAIDEKTYVNTGILKSRNGVLDPAFTRDHVKAALR